MVLGLQNSRGRLVLKLTTEQPRQACFKANYKKGKPMGMVDSQPHLINNRANVDNISDEKEEEAKAPESVPTC